MYLFFYCLVYKKSILSWLNQCNSNWLSSLKLNTMPQFLGCFVKCFHFVWCKMIITSSCQKCVGEGVSIVVSAWWAVSIAKVGIVTATGWSVVDNVNVMASTESRSISRAVVYGISAITMLPWLWQFHRCPSWLVSQREKECLGTISILAAVTCWEILEMKRMINAQTSFKNSNWYRQENILILLVVVCLIPFKVAKISVSWKVFTFEGIIIKWYLSEKLNAKNIEKSDKL